MQLTLQETQYIRALIPEATGINIFRDIAINEIIRKLDVEIDYLQQLAEREQYADRLFTYIHTCFGITKKQLQKRDRSRPVSDIRFCSIILLKIHGYTTKEIEQLTHRDRCIIDYYAPIKHEDLLNRCEAYTKIFNELNKLK